MKSKIILGLIMLAAVVSCKKADTTDAAEPQSHFKVTNQSNSTVLEGQLLKLSNESLNAVSYHWDFGNGTSSNKMNPEFYYVMHGDYTITLTVIDAKGKTSISTLPLTVLCTFGTVNHTPLPPPPSM